MIVTAIGYAKTNAYSVEVVSTITELLKHMKIPYNTALVYSNGRPVDIRKSFA